MTLCKYKLARCWYSKLSRGSLFKFSWCFPTHFCSHRFSISAREFCLPYNIIGIVPAVLGLLREMQFASLFYLLLVIMPSWKPTKLKKLWTMNVLQTTQSDSSLLKIWLLASLSAPETACAWHSSLWTTPYVSYCQPPVLKSHLHYRQCQGAHITTCLLLERYVKKIVSHTEPKQFSKYKTRRFQVILVD